MSDVEFNEYLKIFVFENIIQEVPDEVMHTYDIFQMAIHLCNCYKLIQQKDNDSLNTKLKLGKMLNQVKKIHRQEKTSKNKIEKSWSKWLERCVKMSTSYANHCILMHKIVKIYPKLSQLKISLTEMFRMQKKIKEVFRNSEIAKEWK